MADHVMLSIFLMHFRVVEKREVLGGEVSECYTVVHPHRIADSGQLAIFP